MAKYKWKIVQGELIIKSKLEKGEERNEREWEILSRQSIKGLTKVSTGVFNSLVFSAPPAMPLKSYLMSGITREEFAVVVAQLIRVLKSINEKNLQIRNLELHLDNVFFVQSSKEVLFIYRPVISKSASNDLQSFVEEIIKNASFSTAEDRTYVSELEKMLHDFEQYPMKTMERYVKELDEETYLRILDSKGKQNTKKSSFIAENDMLRAYDKAHVNEDPETDVNDEPYTDYEDPETDVEDDYYTDIEEPETDAPENNNPISTGRGAGFDYYYGNKNYYNGNASGSAKPHVAQPPKAQPKTTQKKPLAVLKRCTTGQMYNIYQTETKIGRRPDKSDIVISDNKAVSGMHAVVHLVRGKWNLVDVGSLNHSYINGYMIPPYNDFELVNDCEIILADEKFIFHSY